MTTSSTRSPRPSFTQFYGFFNSVNEQGVYTETRGNVPRWSSCRPPKNLEHLGTLEIAIAAAKASGDKAWIEKTKKARDEYEKNITVGDGHGGRRKPRELSCSNAAGTTCPIPARRSRRACPRACPVAFRRRRNRLGLARVAGLTGKSIDGPGRRQPDLAAPFRHGPGQNGREFRRSGRASRRTPSCSTGWRANWSAPAGT